MPFHYYSFRFLLCLILLTVLSVSVSHSQESKLYIQDQRMNYSFRPNGKLKKDSRDILELDLNYKQKTFLDSALLNALSLKQSDALKDKTKELTQKAKDFAKTFYRAQKEPEKQKVLEDWNKFLEGFDKKFSGLLTESEKVQIDNSVMAAEFFDLGFVGFVKMRLRKASVSEALLKESSEVFLEEVRTIEKDVWKILLADIDETKQLEFALALRDGLPNRTPALSILWSSLESLEMGDSYEKENLKKLPIFILKSGRLSLSEFHPKPATIELLSVLSNLAKGNKHESLIKDSTQEMFSAHLRLQDHYQEKKADLYKAGYSASLKEAVKKFQKELSEKQLESQQAIFEKLPVDVKRDVRFAMIVADYQRFGIEPAFFSKKNKDLMEFPPSNQDLEKIKKQAKEARTLLENRVHVLVKKTFMAPLREHFAAGSPEVKWLEQKYIYQIPPVELILFSFENTTK